MPCAVFVAELVMLLEWWSGTECVIYTDPRAYPKFGKENAIVVLNHKFEIDFLCGWSLAERFGVLGVSGTPVDPPDPLSPSRRDWPSARSPSEPAGASAVLLRDAVCLIRFSLPARNGEAPLPVSRDPVYSAVTVGGAFSTPSVIESSRKHG